MASIWRQEASYSDVYIIPSDISSFLSTHFSIFFGPTFLFTHLSSFIFPTFLFTSNHFPSLFLSIDFIFPDVLELLRLYVSSSSFISKVLFFYLIICLQCSIFAPFDFSDILLSFCFFITPIYFLKKYMHTLIIFDITTDFYYSAI